MALIEIKKDLTAVELRVFAGVLFPAFCGLVGWMLYLWTRILPLSVSIWGLGAVVLAVGLASPSAVRPVYLGWMYAAYPIGWTISHAVILIVYYCVLTPVGMILRLARYDPLARRFDAETESYWTPRAGQDDKKRYFRQF